MFEQTDDKGIIQKILDGEPALFEILIRKYNSCLYKTGRSYNYNHEDTQDLMQDTFIDAYTQSGEIRVRSSFKTWLIKIMLNNCFKKKQKFAYKNEMSNEINDFAMPMFSSRQDRYRQTRADRELSHVIEEALEQVPEDYRLVFSLREMSGLNVKETAENPKYFGNQCESAIEQGQGHVEE
jgi:RNA polymerase sigma-70 factor (ECF subfamily)